ncbi:LON peptidase substrate-binding domain-containing protein [Phycicoccus sp. Soil802]|uniref:LON peptidase substrate-binding domain-containing protein n=1 Tax=Phycicoccus sp. Soil802 TaxID=1736414 RepID=UPI000702DCF8|nr:LON peptidase substrate-binding domain-containing protein [Phycicoccus sp. Soil802]KRF22437.1 peptidase S16 [Phycicoccus sp. Soil802]
MARLPLFPLGTVLVPGATLPLQLFEPRYLELLSDLVNAMDVPEFGVVAIRQGHEVGPEAVRDLHEVGCVARVHQAAAVGDGRYLVVSTGVRRFRLDALVEGAGTAYLTGEVTLLEERTGDADAVADLADRLRGALHDYAATLGAEEPTWPTDAGELSYAVGTAVRLDLGDRQHLLAAADTETRLRLGLRLVRRERQLAATLGVVPPTPEHGFNPN